MNYLLKSILFLVSLIILSACSASEAELCHGDNCALVRFKAITVLEVDGKLKEFYSVLQAKVVRLEEGQSALGFGGRSKVWREATVIDLGERGRAYVIHAGYRPGKSRYLFAIYPMSLLESYGASPNIGGLEKADIAILKNASGRTDFKIISENSATPTLVYFEDETDQNSIKYLDKDNLSEAFGDGVTLKGFYLERTNEEITDGRILEYLPWLRLENFKNFETAPRGPLPDKWKSPINWPFVWKVTRTTFVIDESLRKSK